MYILKNKDENKNACISVLGLNRIHGDEITGDKEVINAQLNEDWFLEDTSKPKAKKFKEEEN